MAATNAGEIDIFHVSEVGAFEGQFTPTDHPKVSPKETGDFMKVWGNRIPSTALTVRRLIFTL
jgi:hypothetical protein